MSAAKTPITARSIVDDVLGRSMTREIWSGNYEKALPVSVQDFDLSAVLPAVFYMFRFGHRRGKGKFLETFGADSGTAKERRRADNDLTPGCEGEGRAMAKVVRPAVSEPVF